MDIAIVLALLVFALSTTQGVRASMEAAPTTVVGRVSLAFAVNIGFQLAGWAITAGSLRDRMPIGLTLGNRNIGLVWSALSAQSTPTMSLFFAAAQLPIYILPWFLAQILARHPVAPDDNSDFRGEAQ